MGAAQSQGELRKEKNLQVLEKSIDDDLPKENPRIPPHNFDTTISEAEDDLQKGVFLKNKRERDTVDEKSGCNCFIICARELSITWSEDSKYWRWYSLKDTSDAQVEVAELQNVCWLEVHGTYNISHLTPGVTYEVALMVMMKDPAYGWEAPVTLRLTGSSIQPQQHSERLLDKLRGRWIELVVGEFTVTAGVAGDIQFSMFEYENGKWKRGLVIKGAVIRPKK